MFRHFIYALLLVPATLMANPLFDGDPEYVDAESRQWAERLVAAHGGMEAMQRARSLKFEFFTKMIGNPTPFYSIEALDLDRGAAYVDWPFWQAMIAWDGKTAWSRNWPMPLPSGFFVRLTSSFLTLPWQIQSANANIGPVSVGTIPGDEAEYTVLHVTFDDRSPVIPGTFYDIFIDAESGRMKALRFDINHPGMVANPSQPLGPNYHVFGDYRDFDGLLIPTFYKSYGQGSASGGDSNAYHFVWGLQTDQDFPADRVKPAPDGKIDSVSNNWWKSMAEEL